MFKYLKVGLKKRRKSYLNNAGERVILLEIGVISKKKVIASLALVIYAFRDESNWIEVALYALKTMRWTFVLPLRKGLHELDNKPLVCIFVFRTEDFGKL